MVRLTSFEVRNRGGEMMLVMHLLFADDTITFYGAKKELRCCMWTCRHPYIQRRKNANERRKNANGGQMQMERLAPKISPNLSSNTRLD